MDDTQVVVWVTVGPEQINHGVREKCEACPVALGVNGVLKPGYYSVVGANAVDVLSEYSAHGGCGLPHAVRAWIHDFDVTGDGYPFSVALRLPEEAVRTDAREAMTVDEWFARSRQSGAQMGRHAL